MEWNNPANMESIRDDALTSKVTPKDFIRVVNGCLNKYYKDPISCFGSYSYATTFCHKWMMRQGVEKCRRSQGFACIFQDLAKANHWNQTVHYLSSSLLFNLPPVNVIQKLLDTMLVIDTETFVVEAQIYLHQLSTFYPPKDDDMAFYYWEIFKEEEIEQKRVSSPRDPCGSFINILHQLDVELTNLDQENNNSHSIAVNVSCLSLEQNVDDANRFEEEEYDGNASAPAKDMLEYYDSTTLTGKHLKLWWPKAGTEQKIHRLICVLSVMNDIFQMDIDVWNQRSEEAQRHPLARPIISRLLWPYDLGNPSAMIVKMVVNMYAVCLRNDLLEVVSQIERLVNFIALTLPSSPLDGGDGYPPDSHQRRVFAQHVAMALIDSGVAEGTVDRALSSLSPDWLRLIVNSKIHSHRSSQSCGDLPLNVAQLAKVIIQGVFWGDEADCSFDSSICSEDEEEPTTSRRGRRKCGVKRNAKGETQLHILARAGKSEKLSQALEKGGNLINVADYAGWTPVHEAVTHGQLECVRVLCQYKPRGEQRQKKQRHRISVEGSSKSDGSSLAVDLHAKGGDMGYTPLHDAVTQNQIRIADLLLKYGGPSLLNDTTNAGLTPLDLAINEKMKNVLMNRKEEGRIMEKKWLLEMKSKDIQIPNVPSDQNCISLRCMLLHCYLATHCLNDITAKLKVIAGKPPSHKSSVAKNIDYVEKSHDIKALRYFQKYLKSRLSGKISLPEAYLIIFLC
ncbi:SMC5-SMC6 complex localization factor protein 1-like [Hetaerina americana]|uniref:SMC5-SMC6 complex localization factor protein 1-like n=1 Tax=Hetaerina americana TaxID=62018 RepID=UPI003A7F4E02